MPSEFWNDIKYFTSDEFRCQGDQCCGNVERMQPAFIMTLDRIRQTLGFPLIVSSGYRCPKHNNAVSSTGYDGPHTTGNAADILLYGAQAHQFIGLAVDANLMGIGIEQKSTTLRGARFIHVDRLSNRGDRPRPWVWTY